MPGRVELTDQIDALVKDERRSWAEIAFLVSEVDRTSYWREYADSFTEWIKMMASRLHLAESSLFRYLSAGRYYEDLRRSFGPGREIPPLAKLPEKVSPENLELLKKLERVAPKQLFESYAARVVRGGISRREIRNAWKAYRPVLEGRTSRGTNVPEPRFNRSSGEQVKRRKEAAILTGLMSAGPEWTGIKTPRFYRFVPEIYVPALETRFDGMALVRATDRSPLLIIGVEAKASVHSDINGQLRHLGEFCDRLWLALPLDANLSSLDAIPKFVGVMFVEKGGKITVRRPAEERLGARTGSLAKELLSRALQT